MKIAALSIGLLLFGSVAFGHRLDEYLQATTISLDKNRIQAQIRLTPGIAVSSYMMTIIDTDHDGVIATAEQRSYAERVLRDLALSLDGDRLKLQLVSAAFPNVERIKEGLGDIVIDFAADVSEDKQTRKLVFANYHQSTISAYLVNCLAPEDKDISVTGQHRNYEQSFYQLDYSQSGFRSGRLTPAWWSGGRGWLSFLGIVLLARLVVLLAKQRRHSTRVDPLVGSSI